MIMFAVAVFFLIITPGPGVLSTAGIGAAYGFRAGIPYILGLFVGNIVIALAVVLGLATLILTSPTLRTILAAISTLYLLYLAARIAFAGSNIAFIEAKKQPGFFAGFMLQPINPKAYVVNSTLFSGFVIWPNAFVSEVFVKFLIFNAIWLPLHFGWLWAGGALKRLNLSPMWQSVINKCMALAMVIVVGLAAWALFKVQ